MSHVDVVALKHVPAVVARQRGVLRRERDRETERQRRQRERDDRERERGTERERQRDRETERQRDRETERQRDRERHKGSPFVEKSTTKEKMKQSGLREHVCVCAGQWP